jgi:Fic family protein
LSTRPEAAIAHHSFVTIHPFDDGNGRIARAIADLALALSDVSAQRFFSMSSQIRLDRAAYYDNLERTQKGDLSISQRLIWFLGCLQRAITGAQGLLGTLLDKPRLLKRAAVFDPNDSRIKVLNCPMRRFKGKMTSSKWATLAKCSQGTANRDIATLIYMGLLRNGPT